MLQKRLYTRIEVLFSDKPIHEKYLATKMCKLNSGQVKLYDYQAVKVHVQMPVRMCHSVGRLRHNTTLKMRVGNEAVHFRRKSVFCRPS